MTVNKKSGLSVEVGGSRKGGEANARRRNSITAVNVETNNENLLIPVMCRSLSDCYRFSPLSSPAIFCQFTGFDGNKSDNLTMGETKAIKSQNALIMMLYQAMCEKRNIASYREAERAWGFNKASK